MKSLSTLILIIGLSFFAEAKSVYTSCQGEYNDVNTWRGGVVPVSGDSIYINHSLYLNNNVDFINNYAEVSEFGALTGPITIIIFSSSHLISHGRVHVKSLQSLGVFISYEYVVLGGFSGNVSFRDGLKVVESDYEIYNHHIYYYGCYPEYFDSPSGKYVYSSTGSYVDTLPGSGGCDSIVSVEVNLHDSITYVQDFST